MAEIVLCRHAATEHNLTKRFISTTDLPLSAQGRKQCERLREALRAFAFERCLVSPMQRCLQTRELAAPDLPFEIEPTLRETDFGSWEGQTPDWLEHYVPQLLARRRSDPVRFRPPGGESIEDAAARLRPLVPRLRGGGAVLVVSHRVTLGILERLLRNLPLDSKEVAGLEPAEFRIVRA
ncbi:MAG TPA: histidine phosphatase family protein [Candidatus Babeliales bacterium]|nr:histidine phosphatase family protein [Candidatus Babeliales bacterium]